MSKKTRWIFFIVAIVFCAAFMFAVPLNKYAWMLDMDREITQATLPDDANAGIYPLLAGAPSVFLIYFLHLFKTKKELLTLCFAFISLLILWIIRFWPVLVASY